MKKFDTVVKEVEEAIIENILERYNHPDYWDYDLIHEVAHDIIKKVYGYNDDEKISELVDRVIDALNKKYPL